MIQFCLVCVCVCTKTRFGSLSSQMIHFRGDAGGCKSGKMGTGIPNDNPNEKRKKGSGWYKLPTVVGTI